MKKIISLVLAAVLLITSAAALISCEPKDDGKYTVGIIQLIEHDALDAATKGFKDALIAELGEENIEFLYNDAGGDSVICSTIATDYVTKNVDLIMANATAALQAAASSTTKIPVLGTSITEYGVALGLKDFTGTVGNNISGTSDLAPLEDQVKMLLEIFPDAEKVGLLYCSAEPNSEYQVDVVSESLNAKGVETKMFSFADSNEVSAVAQSAAAYSDVIYIPTDNTAASCGEAISAAIGDTPVIAGEEGICKSCGGVATLSISYYDLGVATGKMAAKILRGEADISEMAIEYAPATKKYNPAKCEELGIADALEAKGYDAIK